MKQINFKFGVYYEWQKCMGGIVTTRVQMKENTDMSNKSRDKHEKMIEQVAATMAIENMPLSQACYENLRAMASGEKTREQLTKEITEKYKKCR